MAKQLSSPDPALLEEINELFKQLMSLIREQKKLVRKHEIESEKLKSTFDGRNGRLQVKIDALKKQLAELLEKNRKSLLNGDLKSFTTTFAAFYFRNVSESFKLTDKKEALSIARKLGIVRRVCKLSVSWSVDAKKLASYLEGHPEHIEHFDGTFETTEQHESIHSRPNDTYFTRHDATRLSPESVQLRS